jgi:hypothetical protein
LKSAGIAQFCAEKKRWAFFSTIVGSAWQILRREGGGIAKNVENIAQNFI